jgi:3-hydroxyacyl-[acyl-carrier-protein] dehydratase
VVSVELIDGVVRSARRRPLFDWIAAPALDLARPDIERLLPHRDPFLFVDRISNADLAALTIAGRRRIDPADPVFRGHFPDEPVYPGVLQLEMMGQLGLCLFGLSRTAAPLHPEPPTATSVRALKVHHALYLAPVGPGDELVILAKIIDWNDYTGTCVGQLLKDGTICSFGIMEVYFVGA